MLVPFGDEVTPQNAAIQVGVPEKWLRIQMSQKRLPYRAQRGLNGGILVRLEDVRLLWELEQTRHSVPAETGPLAKTKTDTEVQRV